MMGNKISILKCFRCVFLLVFIFWTADSVYAQGIGKASKKNGPRPPMPVLACNVDTIKAVVPDNVFIESANLLSTSDGCTYCRVDGFVVTEGVTQPDLATPEYPDGVYPKNEVNFMVALPDNFKNRYFFVGLGGAAGYVPDPPDIRLKEGFAVAGTNAGHHGDNTMQSILDWTFAVDRTQALDYAKRGVHVTAVVTQHITRSYYGLGTKKQDLYRYIEGCSGGGRMGNVAAIEYPEDFDGVVASAPGINAGNPFFFGMIAAFILENPERWIEPAKLYQLEQILVAEYDGYDGAIDGLVWDPSKIEFDPVSVKDSNGDPLFTPPQIETLQLILKGVDLFGYRYLGYTLSNPTGWSPFFVGLIPPSEWAPDNPYSPAGLGMFDTYTRGMFGLDYDWRAQFDFTSEADVKKWFETFEAVYPGSGTADPAGLDAFRRAGGKIIFWHGVSDNGISAFNMIRYYEDLAQLQHGYGHTQSFARLFIAPGVFHCTGGPGPQDTTEQAIAAVVRWVEQGKPPEELITHSALTAPPRTFLLCPYPSAAVFCGGVDNPYDLDVNDASNWKCRKTWPHFPWGKPGNCR